METETTYATKPTMDLLRDNSNDHAYFSMLPNCLDDWLDPYQYRLYAHIKRVCGESGLCWQSTKTMADACRMSVGKVSETKGELAEMGLIAIKEVPRPGGGLPYHEIRVVDIWHRNLIHCMDAISQREQASSQGEYASSQGEPKKTPLEEDPTKEEEERGATAPTPPVGDGWSWQETLLEGEPENPAQEQIARMRAKMGADPLSVAAHCQERQVAEGTWTVPEHHGLSPACAVFKEATGYRPGTAQRPVIDEAIPDNDDALEMWFKVCQGWMLTYNNHNNVAGMLDWYAEGRVGKSKPQNGKRNGQRPEPQRDSLPETNVSAPIAVPEHHARWQAAQAEIARAYGQQPVAQWLGGSRLLCYGDGQATVELRDSLCMEWVKDRWADKLAEVLEASVTFAAAEEQVPLWARSVV